MIFIRCERQHSTDSMYSTNHRQWHVGILAMTDEFADLLQDCHTSDLLSILRPTPNSLQTNRWAVGEQKAKQRNIYILFPLTTNHRFILNILFVFLLFIWTVFSKADYEGRLLFVLMCCCSDVHCTVARSFLQLHGGLDRSNLNTTIGTSSLWYCSFEQCCQLGIGLCQKQRFFLCNRYFWFGVSKLFEWWCRVLPEAPPPSHNLLFLDVCLELKPVKVFPRKLVKPGGRVTPAAKVCFFETGAYP